ncbi:hypothetical protein E6O75_ATG04025 [Venturia nashicola]|uniref:Uncharacterized protein n=1 Tax=Venturia nashicola TaxID=86259 RepID=A0A4Z1PM90_9PEZI|nr:hypothetical protein E6O75_ATG04025 [Venturia nashicola]
MESAVDAVGAYFDKSMDEVFEKVKETATPLGVEQQSAASAHSLMTATATGRRTAVSCVCPFPNHTAFEDE